MGRSVKYYLVLAPKAFFALAGSNASITMLKAVKETRAGKDSF